MTTNPSAPIVVRPATAADIEFMVHLFLQLAYQQHPLGDGVDIDAIVHGTRQATQDQVEGKLAHSITNVIEADHQRVGRLRLIRTEDQIMIGGLQLMPAVQGQGIGTTVINEVIAEARTRSVPVVLEVEQDNPRAESLYTRLGFTRDAHGATDATYRLRIPPA